MTSILTVDDGQSHAGVAADPPQPIPVARRVLVVSADIGGGHHATGRALQERVQRLWPGSPVRWVDTLDAMGPGVGRAVRRTYVVNVEMTPWLYEFFYASLWRYRWFADASKWFVGAWAGRGLRPVVEAFDPDVIVSTYPMGSAGLAWLRRRFGLGVPVGAWVSDFAPHPFWVYSGIDLNLLAHPSALPLAALAAPGAPLATCEPPVAGRFHPGDRAQARRGRGLDPSRPMVLIACGSLGFGAVEEAARTLAALGDGIQVVAVCGRNQLLARRLAALGEPAERLLVLEWVDDMPTLLSAADLLITNAGGATVLEAVATGTPVLMYRPIAAHGAANAALMSACSLADTCRDPGALVEAVRSRLSGGPPGPAAEAARGYLPDLGLPALAESGPAVAGRPGRRTPSWPLRGREGLLLRAESVTAAAQLGVVVDLDPRPDGRPLDADGLAGLLAQRLPAIAMLRRRMVDRGPWRRPGWVVDRRVDVPAQLEVYRPEAAEPGAAGALERFWSRPVPTDGQPWRILLIPAHPSHLPGARARVAIKVHRCLGDERSVLDTVRRLLDPVPGVPPTAAGGAPARRRLRTVTHRAWRATRALPGLILAGRRAVARGRAPGDGAAAALARPLLLATVPVAGLRPAAAHYGTGVGEVACAVVLEALCRTYAFGPAGPRLSAMLTVPAADGVPSTDRGDATAAIVWDLPTAAPSVGQRVAALRDRLRQARQSGQPDATGLLIRVAEWLPAPVQAWAARRIHRGGLVDIVMSYLDGPPGRLMLAGAPVRSVAPVVTLTGGACVGVGMLLRGDAVEIGVLVDAPAPGVSPPVRRDAFVAALRDAVAGLGATAGVAR